MKYFENGTLADRLNRASDNNEPLSQSEICKYGFAIARDLQAMHYEPLRMIHRDVQPDNVYIDGSEVYLGGFGYMQAFSSNTASNAQHGEAGTRIYRSPELDNDEDYGYETDIWSLGILLYYMCSGSFPFPSKNNKRALTEYCKG